MEQKRNFPPGEIDYEMLKKMDPVTLKKITDEWADIVHGGIADPKNKKKLFPKSMA